MKNSLFIFFFLFSLVAHATHNRAGEITYRHLSGLTYEFTFVIYADPTSPAFQRKVIEVNWGDNTGTDSIAQTRVTPITTNVSKREFVSQHTFPGPGNYTVSLSDPNRNGGIDNIDNSANVPFYVQALLRISPIGVNFNNSPILLNDPIDDACVGQVFMHNPGAYDIDGDSLSYQIAKSRGLNGNVAPGFEFPPASNSLYVDSETGDLIWDSPTMGGTYNVAIVINEYREGVLIGQVFRDMQITVIPGCSNRPPEINTNELVCVEAGSRLKSAIEGVDPDNDKVFLEATGEPFLLTNSPAIFNPGQALNPHRDTIYWNTNCDHVRLLPYRVSIKAIDDAFNVGKVSLSSFKTQDILVVAPSPKNLIASSFRDKINLSWDNSACLDASGYFIYRRLDSSGFVPSDCQVGVPESTGYVKIATIDDVQLTTFEDNNNGEGLVPGRKYCYLITSYFEDGSESYASEEVCENVSKFVPILTNVSVEVTDENVGEISLEWSPPDTLDTISFPAPYRYLIYESNSQGQVLIDSTTTINDTIYRLLGVNTTIGHSYIVKLYSYGLGKILVGSSPSASSIKLNTTSLDNAVLLQWNFQVSWENDSFVVYRESPASVGFDSIGISKTNHFLDSNLANGTRYCYYVKSIGAYDLTSVKSPLLNNSQKACEIPQDTQPPCAPQFSIQSSCDSNFIEISWNDSLISCASDVVKYIVYRSATVGGEMIQLAEFNSSSQKVYRENLNSIAGCYVVTAIDSANNESTKSNYSCINYCPRYELPNIFTPNGDGINDLFIPFPDYRYVDSIEIDIYSRWGNLVFETNDPDILWDGVDQTSNSIVKEGVYFYNCIVYELSLEGLVPRTLKGTVNVHNPNGLRNGE